MLSTDCSELHGIDSTVLMSHDGPTPCSRSYGRPTALDSRLLLWALKISRVASKSFEIMMHCEIIHYFLSFAYVAQHSVALHITGLQNSWLSTGCILDHTEIQEYNKKFSINMPDALWTKEHCSVIYEQAYIYIYIYQ